jgi:hypothetical protein
MEMILIIMVAAALTILVKKMDDKSAKKVAIKVNVRPAARRRSS